MQLYRYDFIIYSKVVNSDEGQTNDNETSELRDLKIEKLGNKKQKSNFMNQTELRQFVFGRCHLSEK